MGIAITMIALQWLTVSLALAQPLQRRIAADIKPCTVLQNPSARISRAGLQWLTQLPKEYSQSAIAQRLGQPYCHLASNPSFGDPTKWAYPCGWDPETWLIVLFNGTDYAGYDFRFGNRHPN